MFQLLDLVCPIGVCLLSAALCFWASSKTEKIPAKIICITTGAVFLLAILGWYWIRVSGLKPDYVATYGVQVKQGEVNKCEKPQIDEWATWVVNFWSKDYGTTSVAKASSGKLVVCRDEEKIEGWNRFVKGYVIGDVAVVGWNGDLKHTESLFKHELSHWVLTAQGIPHLDEKLHHRIFKDRGLGH